MQIPCTEFNISAMHGIVSIMHKPLIRQALQESRQNKKFNLVKTQKFPQALNTATKKATLSFYFTNKAKGWTKNSKYLNS